MAAAIAPPAIIAPPPAVAVPVDKTTPTRSSRPSDGGSPNRRSPPSNEKSPQAPRRASMSPEVAAAQTTSVLQTEMDLTATGIYNGVFFDIKTKASPILVTAIHVAGTRGGVRAFATRIEEPEMNAMTDWRRWVPVAAAQHVPTAERPKALPAGMSSTDEDDPTAADAPPPKDFNVAAAAIEFTTLYLQVPVPIAAHSIRGFHVHLSGV